jgi:hypothetical protein
MTLKIKYNTEYGIVESVLSNHVTHEELIMETTQCIALAKENNSNLFLSDASNAIIKTSIINALSLEDIHVKEKLKRNSRIALIRPVSKESNEFVSFYETACINRGWDVKIFTDRQSALDWLIKEKTNGNKM